VGSGIALFNYLLGLLTDGQVSVQSGLWLEAAIRSRLPCLP